MEPEISNRLPHDIHAAGPGSRLLSWKVIRMQEMEVNMKRPLFPKNCFLEPECQGML